MILIRRYSRGSEQTATQLDDSRQSLEQLDKDVEANGNPYAKKPLAFVEEVV